MGVFWVAMIILGLSGGHFTKFLIGLVGINVSEKKGLVGIRARSAGIWVAMHRRWVQDVDGDDDDFVEQQSGAALAGGGDADGEDLFAGLVLLGEAENEADNRESGKESEDADAFARVGGGPKKRADKRADTRVRKTNRKNAHGDWRPLPRGQGLTRAEADDRLAELAEVECMGGKWIGSNDESKGWKQRGQKSSKPHSVRVRPCPFFKESDCEARVREIKYADGLIDLERDESRARADHTISNRKV